MKEYHLRPGEKPKKFLAPRGWPEFHEVHGLVAAWKLKGWRLTEHTLGQIPGVRGNLTIIATDGNLGAFLDVEGQPYLGHIERKEGGKILNQGWDGKVRPAGALAKAKAKRDKARAARPKTKKQIVMDLLKAL